MPGGFNNEKVNRLNIDILLVQNNEMDIKMISKAFRNAKLKNTIFVVRDGQEALDYVYAKGEFREKGKSPQPDIILLDVIIPKVDGLQVLEKLKNDPQKCKIPIVMLSSSNNEEAVTKSYQNGAAGYIPKPVEYADFENLVDTFNLYWQVINKLPGEKISI